MSIVGTREAFIEGIGRHGLAINDTFQRTVIIGEGSASAVLASEIDMMQIAALSKGFQIGIWRSHHTAAIATNLDFILVLNSTVNILHKQCIAKNSTPSCSTKLTPLELAGHCPEDIKSHKIGANYTRHMQMVR